MRRHVLSSLRVVLGKRVLYTTGDDNSMSTEVELIAGAMLAALDAKTQVAPLTDHMPLDLGTAYAVAACAAKLRQARGEHPVGRKLGFTNRNIWSEYNVYAPIWSYMYDTTVRSVDPAGADFALASVVEPRIEPEITLGLKRAPEPGMDEKALLDCLDWVAHGFEIVQSLFPGWKFKAPDTVAAFGLHGALLLGPKHALGDGNRREWGERLSSFNVALSCNGEAIDTGQALNVLGGPLTALKNVVEVLGQDPHNPQLQAGEFVTTGTITRAFPIAQGEIWRSTFSGAPFEGLTLRVV
jgi:2-oxo-3-hexenedioate decarboxylase